MVESKVNSLLISGIIMISLLVLVAIGLLLWPMIRASNGYNSDNNGKNIPIPNQTEIKNFCSEQSRTANFCTEQYDPVCGWFNQSIQCIKYPCAQTYSSNCFACMDEEVD